MTTTETLTETLTENPETAAEPSPGATPRKSATPRESATGHRRLLTRRDRLVLGVMAGVPTVLHIALVWVTALASIDGASVWRLYWQIVLPLCRPAMAALATLLSIWIYNDFFWALVLISTGENMPITSALNNLSGQYFTDPNLVAAGALLTAIPTLIVYFVLQRQFVSGLTLGANKG